MIEEEPFSGESSDEKLSRKKKTRSIYGGRARKRPVEEDSEEATESEEEIEMPQVTG
jgi:hypothetical protein